MSVGSRDQSALRCDFNGENMIFYTDRFIKNGFAGCSRGPFIFIRPAYRADEGLIAHERVHRWQWFTTLSLHSFLYLLWPDYKLRSEVEAYREQARYYADDRRPFFAKMICEKYGLNVTYTDVLARLYA